MFLLPVVALLVAEVQKKLVMPLFECPGDSRCKVIAPIAGDAFAKVMRGVFDTPLPSPGQTFERPAGHDFA